MGKTYRSVASGSQSVDYQSDHSRKLLGVKKASSHRSIRSNNKNCDEDTIKSSRDIKHKVKDHWASSYYGKNGNIPNRIGTTLENSLEYEYTILYECTDDYIEKLDWHKSKSRDEIIDDLIKVNCYAKDYLIATQKQIQRRGKVKQFCGHR